MKFNDYKCKNVNMVNDETRVVHKKKKVAKQFVYKII